MTPATEQETLLLHWMRIKGSTSEEDLAAVTRLPEPAVGVMLAAAVAAQNAVVREGRRTTYRLTPEGKERAAALLRLEPRDPEVVDGLYTAFLPLNEQLKEVTSAWQVRDGEPNDHLDRAYDAAVISRLAGISDAISEALPNGGQAPARLAAYGGRFSDALSRVQAGEQAAFARPMANSFHDAWMELHQDLLLTLERERSSADGH